MNIKETISQYLEALESGDLDQIKTLFSKYAVVHSPLNGKVEARKFYQNLFDKTKESKINLLNIFESESNTDTGAGHFLYEWRLKDGKKACFECVDIFRFSADGEIKELRIIYDTSEMFE
ncbi:hypothetical protein AKJ56_01430 [candidate division MSBL1 archaeon SCGC-AAA382N08]|uniref:SnoaL-like domain-containing protein n=1 Tax=candidate division MSBL1 archaeon SCGC-AAA382N08 TaxID=1698285 RepID=A0A133VPN2_9EURY|nr:hypothetical protein AKJ56_01430 [candidate division MSBL1 archaeon SCGC-AAA382N08]